MNSDIAQGSVATFVRLGSILIVDFIANLPTSLSMKEYENRLTFGEVTDESVSIRFWTILYFAEFYVLQDNVPICMQFTGA